MSFWGVVGALMLWGGAQLEGADAPEETLSPWDVSVGLRESVGHKDNLLLSSFNTESSMFTQTAGDLFVYRYPLDGWEFSGILSGEDRRYWQSSTVDKEQSLLASGEIKRSLGDRWKPGLMAQYFYSDQLFDASVLEGVPFRVKALMHRFSGGPSLLITLPGDRRVEVNGAVTRVNFDEPLDDSWELGPKVLFGQRLSTKTDLTLAIWWRDRTYDVRAAPDGTASLRFTQTELEIAARHYWDEAHHWKSRGRLGVEFNDDNGSGYYDYRKWRVSQELTFTTGRFEAMIQGKLLYYEYASQLAFTGTVRRHSETVFGAHVKQGIWKRFSLFAEYEFEWVWDTNFTDRYQAITFDGGLEWEMD